MSPHKPHRFPRLSPSQNFPDLELRVCDPGADVSDQLVIAACPPLETCRKCLWRDVQNPFHIQAIPGTLWYCSTTGLLIDHHMLDDYACKHFDPRDNDPEQ